jgi:DNA-binding response OmpR family regulator
MKGDKLARLLKGRWSGTPVMMLSASAEILLDSGRALPGVNALIGKPFNVTEFRREIARLLEEGAVSANPAGEETWSGTRHGEPAARVA